MALKTASMKNTLAIAYAANAAFGALYSTVPDTAAGTELSGGSPAYARKALSWSAPSNGYIEATVTFDVAPGSTVAGAGVHSAATNGTYLDGGTVTTQSFSSQGQFVMKFTYQQS